MSTGNYSQIVCPKCERAADHMLLCDNPKCVAFQQSVQTPKWLHDDMEALRARLAAANAALAAAREALSQIANGYYTNAAGYNLTAIAQAALHPATKEST